ncbi:MAG TPA: exodeoxyribonuclease V subunit gamma, partial [Polyangiaceae bacterium]|nr:exodeoxyribonuclease V subunit gamma [Polyangiaceae bacterium]
MASLGALLERPKGGPLDPEIIAAPGQGMAVWLSMQLSKQLGVWAAPIRFPRELVDHLMLRVLGEDARELSAVSRDAMGFAIQAELPSLLNEPGFDGLRRYLEQDEYGVRRAELAMRLAATFDQYLTYRSDWVRGFEEGALLDLPAGNQFQTLLFRRVVGRLRRKHLAQLEPRLLDVLSGATAPASLPARISIFGISTLPPLFVRILAQVARHIEVHFFLFSPGAHAWSPEAGTRSRHPLLERLGAVGADFDGVLSACASDADLTAIRHEHFVIPEPNQLLTALQADLAGDPRPAAPELRLEACTATSSIAVHSCHGPMREVEVLHDQLLSLLTRARDPVRPEEVVVMVSDLDTYAPLIDAVFAREPGHPEFIPYVVSDTLLSLDASTLRAFDRMLGMVRGRVTASEVLDILTVPAVLARFDLDLLEADRLRDWVCESGVRWGMDAEHRERMGVPASDNNTFRLGMQRLMLGYALPTSGEALFEGVLPYEQIEGQDLVLLGKFSSFRRRLFHWLRELERPRAMAAWVETLTQLLGDLFSESVESAARLSRIRKGLADLAAASLTARFGDALEIEVVHKLLGQKLKAIAPEHAYLSEGVTFCAMLPMRNVPFRVVCALGMNDNTFPRTPPISEFDLMQSNYQPLRPGDRSLREDDRYLFLEALCQARERVLLFYTGRSVRDNKPRPPSRCVSELLESIERRLGVPARDVVVEHRLQGFSRAYFDARDSRLFSYSKSYLNAARSMARAQSSLDPFVGKPLEAELPDALRLEDLVRFFRSPPAYYLNRRLGIYLDEEDIDVSDREPLELSALDNWRLGSSLIEHLLKGRSLQEAADLLQASLELPHGSWGT